jgi:uncharacterized protein YjiS (DUF1127 family)
MRKADSCIATKSLLLYGHWFRFVFGGKGSSGQTRRQAMYLAASLVRMLRVWRKYNEGLRELNRLDDRELADIGITRCDIQRIAWEGAHG